MFAWKLYLLPYFTLMVDMVLSHDLYLCKSHHKSLKSCVTTGNHTTVTLVRNPLILVMEEVHDTEGFPGDLKGSKYQVC
jgi:hypothetical protein